MNDIFDEKNRLARDIAEGWFSFKKKGDKVGGIIRDIFEMQGRDGLPDQRCFTLEDSEKKLINVGIKKTGYLLSRTNNLQIGDKLGIKFDKEIPPKVKGFNPAKSYIIYSELVGERIDDNAGSINLIETEKKEEEIAF